MKVIQWRLEFEGAASAYPNNTIDCIYERNEIHLAWTFVSASTAYLTENMNSLKSIVNGSSCKLYSLSWMNEIVARDMEQLIEEAAPGHIVLLPNPPNYINILIDEVTTWDPSDSLLGAKAFVIPVPLSIKNPQPRSMIKGSLTNVPRWSLDLQ